MATQFAARCNKCGKLSNVSSMFEGPANGAAFLQGARMTHLNSCVCGGDLVVVEGNWKLTAGNAELTAGPPASWEAIKELAAVVKASIEAGESPEQTYARASRLLPLLGKYKQFAAGLAIPTLLWLVQQVAAIKLSQELTPTPVTQEQAAALVMQSEQRLLEAIEKSNSNEGGIAAVRPRIGLHPNGNPLFDRFPTTARRLAEYERSQRRR